MFKPTTARKQRAATVFVTLLLCSVSLPRAADAQNWGLNPYTGSANWLWIARSLMYPLNRYSSYNAPFYLANSLIWNGSYAANQVITNKNRQFSYGNLSDPEPYNDPRQRTRPLVEDGNAVTDQVVQARRVPQQAGDHAPPVAADSVNPAGSRWSNRSRNAAPRRTSWQANKPLAEGFIDLVNSKYKGDISKALFDPQMRSFAKSIGLIDDDSVFDADLSSQKIETIRGIFADTTEDPIVRINAVHMILKH